MATPNLEIKVWIVVDNADSRMIKKICNSPEDAKEFCDKFDINNRYTYYSKFLKIDRNLLLKEQMI